MKSLLKIYHKDKMQIDYAVLTAGNLSIIPAWRTG